MKNVWKKSIVLLTTFAMLFTLICSPIGGQIGKVEAATSDEVYINPYSDFVVTYKTGDTITSNYGLISIMGCDKKSEIKNLKSSNKNIKVEANDGYICYYFGDKAGTATISCKVKGVKLKTKVTIKKYVNPLKSFKIGSKNYTSKYAKNTTYEGKSISKKKMSVSVKSGWKIEYIRAGEKFYTDINKSKWSKKITVKKNKYITIKVIETKTGLEEVIYYDNY